ncbi:hypothetical protein DFH06DRAFT_1333446 [Mycena polygramma]|nr:hypothetical protein DFH06DRAFT_1333446 [Mycena polygramma]
MPALEDLGEDIALLILSSCDIETVLLVGRVNSWWHRLSLSKQLWIWLIEDLAEQCLLDLPRS